MSEIHGWKRARISREQESRKPEAYGARWWPVGSNQFAKLPSSCARDKQKEPTGWDAVQAGRSVARCSIFKHQIRLQLKMH